MALIGWLTVIECLVLLRVTSMTYLSHYELLKFVLRSFCFVDRKLKDIHKTVIYPKKLNLSEKINSFEDSNCYFHYIHCSHFK